MASVTEELEFKYYSIQSNLFKGMEPRVANGCCTGQHNATQHSAGCLRVSTRYPEARPFSKWWDCKRVHWSLNAKPPLCVWLVKTDRLREYPTLHFVTGEVSAHGCEPLLARPQGRPRTANKGFWTALSRTHQPCALEAAGAVQPLAGEV